MKDITTQDLKESLTLFLSSREMDGTGGWREKWRKGPQLWASLWLLMGKDGFHDDGVKGPTAFSEGFLSSLPLARYRVTIRAGITLPPKAMFLWHLRHSRKKLLLASPPLLIQFNRYLSMTVVETRDE
ncbi:MAG: hypothetical protein K2P93_05585 [Alphaproteobacteria bacterium]|nr:hypothetical protein [Alphaproteobacteria bacterium]